MRHDTDYDSGAGYPDPENRDTDVPPADPELANALTADEAEEQDADEPEADEQAYGQAADEQVADGQVADEATERDATDVAPTGLTDDPASTGVPYPRDPEDERLATEDELADTDTTNPAAVSADDMSADDMSADEVAADDVAADDVAADDVTAGAPADSGYAGSPEAETDTQDGADEADDGATGLDEADGDEQADEYDQALDAEPVTGVAYPETGTGTLDEAAAGAPMDEDRPVLDNFVDETRGADPYAIPEYVMPESADTSAAVAADQGTPDQAEADQQLLDAEAVQDDTQPFDAAVGDEDVAYAGGADADLTDAEALALAGGAAGAGAAAGYASQESAPVPAGTAAAAAAGEMMPGDGDAGMAPMAVVIPAGDAEHLRQRWQQLQLRFIDNPRGTADQAQGLVGEVVDILTSALNQQRDSLDDWRGAQGEDTEIFRAAVMRYRDFFDRLLSL